MAHGVDNFLIHSNPTNKAWRRTNKLEKLSYTALIHDRTGDAVVVNDEGDWTLITKEEIERNFGEPIYGARTQI